MKRVRLASLALLGALLVCPAAVAKGPPAAIAAYTETIPTSQNGASKDHVLPPKISRAVVTQGGADAAALEAIGATAPNADGKSARAKTSGTGPSARPNYRGDPGLASAAGGASATDAASGITGSWTLILLAAVATLAIALVAARRRRTG